MFLLSECLGKALLLGNLVLLAWRSKKLDAPENPSVFFISFKLVMKGPSTLKLLPVKIKQRLIFNHCALGKQNAVAEIERSS